MLRFPKFQRRTWLLLTALLYMLLVNGCAVVRYSTGSLLWAVGAPDKITNTLIGHLPYSTLHGEFTGTHGRGLVFGNTLEALHGRFKYYKQCHPNSPDTVLYRTYRFEPYMFWEVGAYLITPEWKLPYLAPQQVQPRLKPEPASICPQDLPEYYWRRSQW